jgi:hypothetical protein
MSASPCANCEHDLSEHDRSLLEGAGLEGHGCGAAGCGCTEFVPPHAAPAERVEQLSWGGLAPLAPAIKGQEAML